MENMSAVLNANSKTCIGKRKKVIQMKFGVPTDKHLEKINKMAKRTLSKDEVFVYPHKMAGDMIIPHRYIQLTKQLLNVFVNNANDGVAFLLDHSWTYRSPKHALPYGKVFEGWLGKESIVEGETISFNGTNYIVRDQEKDGISTNSIISDIETGILFDTSIGWGADFFECSICGNDIRNYYKCPHIPGKKYVIDDSDSDGDEVKLCYAMAKPPGYLMEDSAVFDGAYPGAGTSLSKHEGIETNEGTFVVVDDFKSLSQDSRVYGTYSSKGGILTFVKKSEHKKVYAMSNTKDDLTKGGGNFMSEELKQFIKDLGLSIKDNENLTATDVLAKLEKKFTDDKMQELEEKFAQDRNDGSDEKPVFLSQEKATEFLGKEISADVILQFAKEGMDYRQELIKDTIEWGVRAQGNSFKRNSWENMLSESGRTIDAIKDFKEQFKKTAENEIPVGRHTSFENGESNHSYERPDDYFKV